MLSLQLNNQVYLALNIELKLSLETQLLIISIFINDINSTLQLCCTNFQYIKTLEYYISTISVKYSHYKYDLFIN